MVSAPFLCFTFEREIRQDLPFRPENLGRFFVSMPGLRVLCCWDIGLVRQPPFLNGCCPSGSKAMLQPLAVRFDCSSLPRGRCSCSASIAARSLRRRHEHARIASPSAARLAPRPRLRSLSGPHALRPVSHFPDKTKSEAAFELPVTTLVCGVSSNTFPID